jgi:hypothetical protein
MLSSLFGAKEALITNGIESELEIFDGNCHVDDARNRLVRDFLESECTELVFVDTDVRFTPEDIVKLILHDKDVVAGIYPLKQDDEDFPVRFIDGEIWADKNGLIEVESVPTGFLKIRKAVIEKLYENAVKFKSKQDYGYRMLTPIIFERTVIEHRRLGGDYEFCRKWKEIGGKIYIDPEMSFGHSGQTEWAGRLGDFLRKRAGLNTQYIVSLLNNIKNNDNVEENIYRLCETWGNKWALSEEQLIALYEIIKDRDGAVFESGSGLSTLILGALGKQTVSFENDIKWYDNIKKILDAAQFDSVRLEFRGIKDDWYDTSGYVDDLLFSMIVCDGPAREIASRSKISDFVRGKITEDAAILIDDYGSGVLSDNIKELGFNITPMGIQKRYAVGQRIR